MLLDIPFHYTVTYMTITRQQFGKHVSEVAQAPVEGPPLLGSKSLGMFNNNG
jgi:hypothetical protein